MLRSIIKNKDGTSLIEMMVTLAIFTTIVLSATGIFQMALEGQRNAIAGQNIQESMRYAFEVISKEIRMAQRAEDDCPPPLQNLDYHVYHLQGQNLQFKNYDGQCVVYGRQGTRFQITRDSDSGSITPDDIEISDIDFVIADDWDPGPVTQQSRVTTKIEVEASGGKQMHKSATTLQTTISSRYYE